MHMAQIWAAVLGLERVGLMDNFFELGGNSLTAASLIAKIRQHFKVEINISQLFDSPTVAGLSDKVEQTRANGNIQLHGDHSQSRRSCRFRTP
jgi:acyl carrier protein